MYYCCITTINAGCIISSQCSSLFNWTPISYFITKWGSIGTDNGQFVGPDGITAYSSNNMYVADAINYRIQKFDSNGYFITKWGSNGIDDGQFNGPQGIAIDSYGKVYVTGEGNNRIQVFAPDVPILSANDKDNVDGNNIDTIPNNISKTTKNATSSSHNHHHLQE